MPQHVIDFALPAILFALIAAVFGVTVGGFMLAAGAAVASFVLHIITLGFLRTDDIEPAKGRSAMLDHGQALRISGPLFAVIVAAPIAFQWLSSVF